ncbi:NAD(P)-binding protein [Periconia macrospinosa]|uniref:NAD(P)-binding protein n=1 Tax=Periconia macrospinosa TaxID=97972 RepID=A0A2V1DUJ8_9PLEO|nr:NAD(P)-binding protein [Periconia macrospinosa]
MARIFITGSSDGLGQRAAKQLIKYGHQVVLHARNEQRAKDAAAGCPGAETVVVGELSTVAETKALASKLNELGIFDCVIHNAGLFRGPFRKTADGVPVLVNVNVLAPYILTSLMHRPKRIVFLSSSMHKADSGDLDDVLWLKRGESAWDETTAYSASKLQNILFAKAFARRWPEINVSVMDPGWVATKMGGSSATGSPEAAVATYTMLAEGTEPDAQKGGRYFEPGQKESTPKAVTEDAKVQDQLLAICADFTGVSPP